MLMTKLKLAVGAVMVVTALSASVLVYRASGQSAPVTTEKKKKAEPPTELEVLRQEVEVLKLKMEVVQEKLRAQEAEFAPSVATPQATGGSGEGPTRRPADLRSPRPNAGLYSRTKQSSTGAAPAPAPDRAAKEKLEALKKRLPAVAGDWLKEKENIDWLANNQLTCNPELRVLRRVGPDRAKAVILFEAFDGMGVRERRYDLLLTIFLSYQDGCWNTERFEATTRVKQKVFGQAFPFLMLAIDEAAEKP